MVSVGVGGDRGAALNAAGVAEGLGVSGNTPNAVLTEGQRFLFDHPQQTTTAYRDPTRTTGHAGIGWRRWLGRRGRGWRRPAPLGWAEDAQPSEVAGVNIQSMVGATGLEPMTSCL